VITTVKKKYQLAVDTEKARSSWLEILLDAITKLQTEQAKRLSGIVNGTIAPFLMA
jgi:hypothetical protein